MYCVTCGVVLTDDNQEGITCVRCKRELRKREHREKKKPLVAVHYCYACGQPYQPTDASIQHVASFSEKGR